MKDWQLEEALSGIRMQTVVPRRYLPLAKILLQYFKHFKTARVLFGEFFDMSAVQGCAL